MPFVRVVKKVPARLAPIVKKTVDPLTGKVVFWKTPEGKTLAGKVASVHGGTASVRLAAPCGKKELMLSDATVTLPADLLGTVDLPVRSGTAKAWEQSSFFKKVIAITEKDEGMERVKDYLNVTIEGYGSTFENFTKADRAGDKILPSAFDETLDDFRRNPVMLRDHWMDTDHTIGKWTSVETDAKGLRMVGQLSNADDVRDVRFKIAEGILTTLSIGGLFLYQDDSSTIEKIYLYETSVVVVPCNPDATFAVRSLDIDTVTKAFDFRGFFS